ncbi:MAG TPA: hypothetical protein VI653_23095 [Steroidobacteraceae bacterium]
MSNDVVINVKVDGKESQTGLDAVGEKAKQSSEKVTQGFVRARDELGRFVKAGKDTQETLGGIGDTGEKATQKLNALGRLLSSLKLAPIDLNVSPETALKAIEETRARLKILAREAGTSAQMKIDIDKATSGLNKLEKNIGDVGGIGQKVAEFLTSNFGSVGQAAVDMGEKLASSAAGAALLEGAGTAASGGLNLLGSAAMALAGTIPILLGGFAALGPAIIAAGGAAGAAATLFAAAGIGLGTLMMGLSGISDALKAHTKLMNQAGGAAQNTAEQEYQAAKRIHDAEVSLSDAKRAEADAAQAVNRSRQDEVTRLRELKVELEGLHASQADAAQALIEAKEKQRRADIAGSDWEKANARNAVADAQARYDSITLKLNEASDAKKKADKVGIDGSDQVQAALKRQASAHEQVIKAEEALADAHHKTAVAAGASSAAATAYDQAMANLSPNAKKLVNALIELQDKFHALKMTVQDRLLAGFDTAVTDLADKWLPHLVNILGGTADHLNTFGKNLMKALGDNEFIKNIERAGKEGEKFIDTMSPAVDGLVDAFGRLAGHSGPVLQVIAKAIAGIFTWFDKWIKSADRSGKLDSFMQTAANLFQKIFDIGGKAVTVVGKFVAIIFPSSVKAGNSILDTISEKLDELSAWLDDPKHQQWIKAIAESVGEFIALVVKKGIPAIVSMIQWFASFIKFLGNAINEAKRIWNSLADTVASVWNWIVNAVARSLNWISSSAHAIGNGLYSMWEGMRQGFRDVINWVIDRWNSLHFRLPDILGGGEIGVPRMGHFAHGGVSGGGWAEVGEHGRELIKLPSGSTVIPHGQSENMLSQSNGPSKLILGFERQAGSKLMDAIVEGLQTYIKARGGNVQVALGRHGA